MNSKWNPDQYNKFKTQRTRPFYDLISLIQDETFDEAVDLGCGTGELTLKLFEYLQIRHLMGIDSSKEMLEKSKSFARPGLQFELQDIADFEPTKKLDLIFSNAALQWLPYHEILLPKILRWLRSGGQVAIQVPCNFDHPSHKLARQVAHQLFPHVYQSDQPSLSVLPVEKYAEILYQNGCKEQIARIEVYGNRMNSGLDVIEWTKGTLLTSYQETLNSSDFELFLKTYTEEVRKTLGEGPYFYAFKRTLLWGRKI